MLNHNPVFTKFHFFGTVLEKDQQKLGGKVLDF